MVIKRGFSTFDKNTDKYIILKYEILLQHSGFLFYYFKNSPISVMIKNEFSSAIILQCHMIFHKTLEIVMGPNF